MELSHHEIFRNLGMALYLHGALVKQAALAHDAVEYLAAHGVFDGGIRKRASRTRRRRRASR